MVVCHCRVVTDRRIREAIESGAVHASEIGLHCGAGTRCGGCAPALQRLLAEYGLCDGRDVAAEARAGAAA